MIIVVEGVSAAGKTTWASRYSPAVVDETCAIPPVSDVAGIGRFWTEKHVQRWQRGLKLEKQFATVCMDTDPMKIHYAWCLWQIGEGSRDVWWATVESTREAMRAGQIGFADRIIFLQPDQQTVREQKQRDLTRRRLKFELHLRLGPALRRWYELLEQLSPGRVVFHTQAIENIQSGSPRDDRYSITLLDAFIHAADRVHPAI